MINPEILSVSKYTSLAHEDMEATPNHFNDGMNGAKLGFRDIWLASTKNDDKHECTTRPSRGEEPNVHDALGEESPENAETSQTSDVIVEPVLQGLRQGADRDTASIDTIALVTKEHTAVTSGRIKEGQDDLSQSLRGVAPISEEVVINSRLDEAHNKQNTPLVVEAKLSEVIAQQSQSDESETVGPLGVPGYAQDGMLRYEETGRPYFPPDEVKRPESGRKVPNPTVDSPKSPEEAVMAADGSSDAIKLAQSVLLSAPESVVQSKANSVADQPTSQTQSLDKHLAELVQQEVWGTKAPVEELGNAQQPSAAIAEAEALPGLKVELISRHYNLASSRMSDDASIKENALEENLHRIGLPDDKAFKGSETSAPAKATLGFAKSDGGALATNVPPEPTQDPWAAKPDQVSLAGSLDQRTIFPASAMQTQQMSVVENLSLVAPPVETLRQHGFDVHSDFTSNTLRREPLGQLDDNRAFVVKISQHAVQARNDTFEIQLSPEELGTIKFRITQSESGPSLIVTVDRAETLELLRRYGDDMAREFEDLGIDRKDIVFEENNRPYDQTNDDDNNGEQPSSEQDENESSDEIVWSIGTPTGLDIRI